MPLRTCGLLQKVLAWLLPDSGQGCDMNTTTTAFRDALRTQQSLLAPAEKRCLIWIASRMPVWINSDHLTALGLLGMLGTGLSYWWASAHPAGLLLASFWLMVNWFGDSLDGTLARVRNRLRPRYGFYVDHICDTFGSLFLLGGLALSGHMNQNIAFGLLIVYLMLAIEIFLATYTLGNFRISYWKFSPTEVRILLAIGNLALWLHPAASAFGFGLFDIGGIAGIVGMMMMLLNSVRKNATLLYRAEAL